MRHRILTSALVGVLVISGCENPEPLSPRAPERPLFASGAPTPFMATLNFPEDPVDEGQVTVTRGVTHIRNQVNEGTISGNINGDATAVLNADWSLTTEIGPVHGTFTFITDVGDFEGVFAGRQITEELASGDFRVRGSGGVIIGTFTGDGVVLELTGRIRLAGDYWRKGRFLRGPPLFILTLA